MSDVDENETSSVDENSMDYVAYVVYEICIKINVSTKSQQRVDNILLYTEQHCFKRPY